MTWLLPTLLGVGTLLTLAVAVSQAEWGTLICNKCANGKHHKCKGGTWCDCQHRTVENEQRTGQVGIVKEDGR